MKSNNQEKNKIIRLAVVSMNVAILVLSSWIGIPLSVNITLQTLAIFIICSVFDFSVSMMSVAVYICLGAIGLPVFSSFGSGLSALFGPTGGFLLSFLLIPIIFSLSKMIGVHKKLIFVPMLISQAMIYIAGAMWFCLAYSPEASFTDALFICVIPFIIPDLIKSAIAVIISLRLPKFNL